MNAELLQEHFVVPRRDHRNRTGYQRDVSTTRVNKLIKDLKDNRVDLPTSILLNLRDFEPLRHITEEGGRRYLVIQPGDELQVVDGQHRVEALRRLVDEDPERWGAFEIPVVCMLGATFQEEMRQFYVVNSTAKSVRTDLALDLLKQRAESEPGVMDSLIETGEVWKVRAQTLAEEMAKTPAWKGRIRFPGDPTADTTINSSGMVGSLKQVLSTPYFAQIGEHQQLKILDAYWRGIRKALPEALDDPGDYVLQKATGVMVMHSLLVSVIEVVRSSGKSLIEPETYAELLAEPLANLEGDTSSGGIARGPEFWLAGPEGAAGSYSSNAGRRVLGAKLRSALPQIEVE
jgi:DGQHR domain-containing protein